MANLNKVMLIGRLTRDPESRAFSNGGKVVKFGFAVNNRKKNQASGNWEDDPVYLDCEIFNRGESGREADRLEQTVRKGQQIFLEGHLRMDQWEKDGQKRSKMVIVVDNFQYLEPRGDGAPAGGYSGGRTGSSRPSALPARAAAPARSNGNSDYDAESDFDREPSGGSDNDIPF